MSQNLYTTQLPAIGNNFENAPLTLATAFYATEAGSITGGRMFAASNPQGTFQLVLWEVLTEDIPSGSGTGTVLAQVNFPAMTAGTWNSVSFAAPVAIQANKAYKIGVRMSLGSYAATGAFWNSDLVNGSLVGVQSNTLNATLNKTLFNGSYKPDATDYPNQTFNATSYFIDPTFEPAASTTPVTSSLTAKWKIYEKVTSSLVSRWYLLNRVSSYLTAKWTVLSNAVAVSSGYLSAQRAATLAYIADDPTQLVLVPREKVPTATGGYTYVDGVPRSAQTVKMILLGSDQRPTVTVAGVERVVEYHLLGRWDMAIAVGDIWDAPDGTKWEVTGFTEGWDYMTKAFLSRHVPRGVRP